MHIYCSVFSYMLTSWQAIHQKCEHWLIKGVLVRSLLARVAVSWRISDPYLPAFLAYHY